MVKEEETKRKERKRKEDIQCDGQFQRHGGTRCGCDDGQSLQERKRGQVC